MSTPTPVAFAVFADNGNIRIWSTSPDDINDEIGEIIPLYAQPKQTEQYTHAKRPYMAHAIQYNGNAETIMQLVPSLRLDWVGGEINARIGDNIRHLKHGDWVVKGENGNVKIYDNATFNVKYTKLNSEF
jgi:hypothetical protein